jgi:hypothetical protein
METFKAYPRRQRPQSFTVDLEKLNAPMDD